MVVIALMFVVHCLLDSSRLSSCGWPSSLIGALVGQGRQLGHESDCMLRLPVELYRNDWSMRSSWMELVDCEGLIVLRCLQVGESSSSGFGREEVE